MGRHVTACLESLTAYLHAAVCIISVAMLLSFPATKVHSFDAHFRTPEVRRAIERYTPVAHSAENSQKCVARPCQLPTFFTPSETDSRLVPLHDFELASEVPVSRLFNRLKLNPSGSNGQDPLLQA